MLVMAETCDRTGGERTGRGKGLMRRSAGRRNMKPGKKTLTPSANASTPLQRGEGPGVRSSRDIIELARKLRKKQTPTEQILWECLRGRRLAGLKFRRQHPIDKFIADFYCHEARLVVEVDGAVHREKNQIERDALRTEVLSRLGLSVVRVTNTEVETALRKVLTRIVHEAQAGK